MNNPVFAHMPASQPNNPNDRVYAMAIDPTDEAHLKRCLCAIGHVYRD